jgi:squalene-associated FAD-dependent desaturase
MTRTVHIVGAGLAGLSAATRLSEAGERVMVHEGTTHAGGRCRSYHDPVLDMSIDNGNHIILSGNRSALAYLRRTGGDKAVSGPPSSSFRFADLASGDRWVLDLGRSRIPWWVVNAARRVPGTRVADYLAPTRLVLAPGRGRVSDVMPCRGALYQRLLGPLLLATLNNDPKQATARLASAVIRETVAAGGDACRPLIALEGLSAAYVDPALAFLRARGATVAFGRRLQAVRAVGDRVTALEFGDEAVQLDRSDGVILAVPAETAGRLLADLTVPTEFRSIANLHYSMEGDVGWAMGGVINALTQWIFTFPGRLSVTISNADAMPAMPREQLARHVWGEVAQVTGLPPEMPAWQIVFERRATFATVPEQEARRPGAQTRFRNLFLAGDWIATGLPPTIEGAVRSGERAAELAAA